MKKRNQRSYRNVRSYIGLTKKKYKYKSGFAEEFHEPTRDKLSSKER